MKILVGNNGFDNPGGSETYAYSLIEELVRQGHEVHAVGKVGPGLVSSHLKTLGVPVFFKPVRGVYDLVLLSHSTSIEMTEAVKGFKIQTCHGIYPDVEQPVEGMDRYVSISQEVHSHLERLGIDSTIIYNGVSTNRYKPLQAISKVPGTVLSLCHSDKANNLVKRVTDRMECKLIIKNKYNTPIWAVENLINQADIVIGLGRGVYEAASCSRNVIIFDYRNYMGSLPIGDGFLTSRNFKKYLSCNCSGRYSYNVYDENLLFLEMLNYEKEVGEKLRSFVRHNLNIEKQVGKYLELVR